MFAWRNSMPINIVRSRQSSTEGKQAGSAPERTVVNVQLTEFWA